MSTTDTDETPANNPLWQGAGASKDPVEGEKGDAAFLAASASQIYQLHGFHERGEVTLQFRNPWFLSMLGKDGSEFAEEVDPDGKPTGRLLEPQNVVVAKILGCSGIHVYLEYEVDTPEVNAENGKVVGTTKNTVRTSMRADFIVSVSSVEP